MFEIMIFTFVYAIWIGLILSLPVLFLFRVVLVYKQTFSIKEKVLIVSLPLSFGVYQYLDENRKGVSLYKKAVILSFILMFLGSILLFYMHLELTFI